MYGNMSSVLVSMIRTLWLFIATSKMHGAHFCAQSESRHHSTNHLIACGTVWEVAHLSVPIHTRHTNNIGAGPSLIVHQKTHL